MLTAEELQRAYAYERVNHSRDASLLNVQDAVLADAEKDFKVRLREAERAAWDICADFGMHTVSIDGAAGVWHQAERDRLYPLIPPEPEGVQAPSGMWYRRLDDGTIQYRRLDEEWTAATVLQLQLCDVLFFLRLRDYPVIPPNPDKENK